MVEDGDDEDGGLTIDDTSEFVRAITYDPNAVKKEPVEPTVKRDRKSTRLNSSHSGESRMPSSA